MRSLAAPSRLSRDLGSHIDWPVMQLAANYVTILYVGVFNLVSSVRRQNLVSADGATR